MSGPHVLDNTIERRTLHDEVVERMRDMVIEGQLAAETRINESELCQRLGVSRTPVREAIKTLASEGLIELVRNKSAIVKRLGIDEIIDMLEAVAVLELYAARAGVERGSDDEIRNIVAMHKSMRDCFKDRDRLAYYKLNQSIHAAIVALAHNQTIIAAHETLQMRLRRIRYIGNERPQSWSGAMREHEAMMKALKKRDGDKLCAAIEEHLAHTRERVVSFLQDTAQDNVAIEND
ncbi:MAG: GntR family transcriptional regulator [Hyphomicrobiaceae bacterium]